MVLPKRIASTGWPAVRATCAAIDIEFDPWQADSGRAILGKRRDGLYAADTIVISIPRQVGKTFLIAAIVFALCIIFPGITVIWTAHRFKTARETFESLRGMALRPVMAPHIDPQDIKTAAGNERIGFRNGSRIVFGARERGGGRGFSSVDILVLDEAQILSENAMSDLAPTTNQAPNPLIFLTGTPPRPIDPGEMFTMLRTEALSGESDSTLYIEFSADRDADPDDREQWRKANPSYPKRTSARAILRMRKVLSRDSFMREALGVWDEAGEGTGAVDMAAWRECVDAPRPVGAPVVLVVETTLDRQRTVVVAVGGRVVDGLPQIEVADARPGVRWVAERVVGIVKANPDVVDVLVDNRSPAAPLAPDIDAALEAEGLDVSVTVTKTADLAEGAAQIVDAVSEKTLRHPGDPEMTSGFQSATPRPYGDGALLWSRSKGGPHAPLLIAATLAYWRWRALAVDPYDPLANIY